jgi:TonB family protein
MDIRPEYPAEAQAQGIQGAGIFRLNVQQNTGRVMSVAVEKSTGYKMLDNAAVAKFGSLRFKPGAVTRVTIPLEFKMVSSGSSITRGRGYPATALFMNQRLTMPMLGKNWGGRK